MLNIIFDPMDQIVHGNRPDGSQIGSEKKQKNSGCSPDGVLAAIFIFLSFTVLTSAQAASGVTAVRHSLSALDLSVAPSTEELMAAGQLGGQLYPTEDGAGGDADDGEIPALAERRGREREINMSFGRAIEEWNRHNYRKAVTMFRQHVKQFPQSPWVSEARLHVGCDARYNGRYTEAEEQFSWIIDKNRDSGHEGAKMLLSKARSRLGTLKVLQGNFREALNLFSAVRRESPAWRDRTYASHWIQRLSRYRANEHALLSCGSRALSHILTQQGRHSEAREVLDGVSSSLRGQSMDELKSLAEKYGYTVEGVRIAEHDLSRIPLPAVALIEGNNEGDRGHYWVVEAIGNNIVTLYDPQSGRRFYQNSEDFLREWDGRALVFSEANYLPGDRMTRQEMAQAFVAFCGAKMYQSGLGDHPAFSRGEGRSCLKGSPAWKVNMINMNFYLTDIPLWYEPPVGPPVRVNLSYNSQAATAYSQPFGNKWMLNYGSYLTVDTGQTVTIMMPDGRIDVYSPDEAGGYSRPYEVFNDLVKVAENHYELHFPDGIVYEYNIPQGTMSQQPFLVEIRDAYDQKLTIGYNSTTIQIESLTDAQNRVTALVDSDGDGHIDRIDDPFGRSALFFYDDKNNLVSITDMGGYVTRFEYDQDVYLTRIENEGGAWEVFIEPSDGAVAYTNDYPPPGGAMWESYRITVKNPLGNKEEYFYHGGSGYAGGVSRDHYSWYVSPGDYVPYASGLENNFINAPKSLYYHRTVIAAGNDAGAIEKVITPRGGYIEYSNFDDRTGKPGLIHEYHGQSDVHTMRYTFNERGSISEYTDAKGNRYSMDYFPNGIDVKEIRIDLASTAEDDAIIMASFTYHGNTHDVATVTDRMGNVTEILRDSVYGQLIEVVKAKGTASEMRTVLVYDAETRDLLEIQREGSTMASFTYDAMGRVRTASHTGGATLTYHEYSSADQPLKITFPDTVFDSGIPLSSYIDITYSSCCPGMIDSITDRGGVITTYTYNAAKQVTEMMSPQGKVSYEYDGNGNLTRLIDADNRTTRFEYDLDNRMTGRIYADGASEAYEYDHAGLLLKMTNARNIEKRFTYDDNHNLLSITYSDATPGVVLGYDDFDRVSAMTDGIGLTQYSYDGLGRLTSIDGPWEDDLIIYAYDSLGHIKSLIPQKGESITYWYDYDTGNPGEGLGRLQEIKSGTNTFAYAYAGASPLIRAIARPDGSVTEYLYGDPLQRLTEISSRDSTGTIINKHSFTYNNLDGFATETVETGIQAGSFPEGIKTYGYNAANQLLSSTNPYQAFQYDHDGNMIRGYTPEGHLFTAAYDGENRLTSLEYIDGSGISHRTEYFYRGEGMLAELRKITDGTIRDALRIVRAGFLPVQERDENNNVTREYTWGLHTGGGIGGLLHLRHSGQGYFYLYDGRGNVMAVVDGSSHMTVASYRYDEFGDLRAQSGSFDQPFMFSTKRYDEETGLSYYGFRFYNPSIGRWMSRDPLGEAGGLNLYGFVGNNAVNVIDPWGLWGKDVHSGIGNEDYGTYLWARDVGMPEAAARMVAHANNAIDSSPWTSWLPFWGDQTRHFNDQYLAPPGIGDTRSNWAEIELARAVKYAKEGDCRAAWGHLGKGLHSIQDKYAHRDWNTGFYGAAAHPLWYDDWYDPRNMTAARLTEVDTKKYINKFLLLTR
ncbi:MAG: hypothetical protein JSU90_04090 [Nitrospiraceae bacterium]|nr:MAG: hypothetical protein JSU90_04090 [Nitrospiraceae bacterium]